MEGWQVALLVIGIIIGVYIIMIAMDLIFVYSFKSIFKKHNTALGVMVHSKYENIKRLMEILNKNSVDLPYKYVEIINSINANSFLDQELAECIKARNDMAYLRNELLFVISSDEILSKNLEIKRAKDAITEMDANYRTLVAMYNADVLGYNYWINFLPTRYLKKLLKLENKQIIS